MTSTRRVVNATLLAVLPTAVLATGIVQLAVISNPLPSSTTTVALVASAMAPVAACLLLLWAAPSFDLTLVTTGAMLTSIGTAAHFTLASAQGPDQEFYATIATRHGLFVAAGFAALVAGAASARRIDLVTRYPYTILLAALALTSVTILAGETINGARLWLEVGPIQFQPSEIARLLLVVFMASYLHERRHLVAAPWRVGGIDFPPAPYLAPLAGAVLCAVAVLVLQNDLGMAAIIVLSTFATVSGALRSRTAVLAATAMILLAAAVAYSAVPRVRDRVAGWLDPWADPLGRGFQLVQADFSLSGAGVLGSGNGSAAVRVPEVQTDFILIGIGAQFGLATALAVMALSGILVIRCLINAMRASHGFGVLLGVSLGLILSIQIILIAGGTLRVLPLTGLTFPLVSYGGTSMIATMFALGIIVGLGAGDDLDRARCRPTSGPVRECL